MQFECMARGNGWSLDKGEVDLIVALHGAATEVFTTMPNGATSVPELISAPKKKKRFGVKLQKVC